MENHSQLPSSMITLIQSSKRLSYTRIKKEMAQALTKKFSIIVKNYIMAPRVIWLKGKRH